MKSFALLLSLLIVVKSIFSLDFQPAYAKIPKVHSKAFERRQNSKKIRTIYHLTEGFAAALSPDGTILARASEPPAGKDWPPGEKFIGPNPADPADVIKYSTARGFLSFWNTKTGKLIRSIRIRTTVDNLEFSPDGKTLLASTTDYSVIDRLQESVRVWDVKSGRLKHTLAHSARSMAFSPDGRLAAFDTGAIQLYNSKTWSYQRTLVGGPEFGVPFGLRFSRDSRRLATVWYSREAMEGSLSVWDIRSRKRLLKVGEEADEHNSEQISFPIAFLDSKGASSQSQKVMISGDNYLYCRVSPKGWKFVRFRKVLGSAKYAFVALHTGRRTLAVYSPGGFGPQFELWDVDRKKRLTKWTMPSSKVMQVKFSDSGNKIVTTAGLVSMVVDISGMK